VKLNAVILVFGDIVIRIPILLIMSAKFALDLERVFGISAEFWVTIQAKWELKNARDVAA